LDSNVGWTAIKTTRRSINVMSTGGVTSLLGGGPARFTRLLTNEQLSRLERMRLWPTARLTNRNRGEHLSGKGGTSTEFSDYRDYVAGDDVRYVDWNIFARLHRPYVKQYRYEEEMNVVLLLDASASMKFDGKFDRGVQLAAACGLLGLMNIERVSVYAFNTPGSQPQSLPPCTGRVSRKRLFDFLEGLRPGGDYPIEGAIEHLLRWHRGRGVCVLISDFLTFADLTRPFNLLFSGGLEMFAAQILSPAELNPEVTGDLRFVDSESGHTLDVSSAGDLIGVYHEHLAALQETLSLQCRQRRGKFVSISSGDDLDAILFDTLRRQGWIR
jgi:uncharacterized protein (DUF58 family)